MFLSKSSWFDSKNRQSLYRGWFPVITSVCCSNFVYFYTFRGLKAVCSNVFSNSAALKDLSLGTIAGIVHNTCMTFCIFAGLLLLLQSDILCFLANSGIWQINHYQIVDIFSNAYVMWSSKVSRDSQSLLLIFRWQIIALDYICILFFLSSYISISWTVTVHFELNIVITMKRIQSNLELDFYLFLSSVFQKVYSFSYARCFIKNCKTFVYLCDPPMWYHVVHIWNLCDYHLKPMW